MAVIKSIHLKKKEKKQNLVLECFARYLETARSQNLRTVRGYNKFYRTIVSQKFIRMIFQFPSCKFPENCQVLTPFKAK